MNEEDKQKKFLRYEELKMQEKEIKEEIETLKAELVSEVPADEKINCRFGVIELKKRDNWKYTPETTELATSLKAKQKEEVAKGIATNVPTFFIEYRQKDDEVV